MTFDINRTVVYPRFPTVIKSEGEVTPQNIFDKMDQMRNEAKTFTKDRFDCTFFFGENTLFLYEMAYRKQTYCGQSQIPREFMGIKIKVIEDMPGEDTRDLFYLELFEGKSIVPPNNLRNSGL